GHDRIGLAVEPRSTRRPARRLLCHLGLLPKPRGQRSPDTTSRYRRRLCWLLVRGQCSAKAVRLSSCPDRFPGPGFPARPILHSLVCGPGFRPLAGIGNPGYSVFSRLPSSHVLEETNGECGLGCSRDWLLVCAWRPGHVSGWTGFGAGLVDMASSINE